MYTRTTHLGPRHGLLFPLSSLVSHPGKRVATRRCRRPTGEDMDTRRRYLPTPQERRAAGCHVSMYVMCLPHRARSADRRPGASQAPPGLAEPTHQCHGDSSVTGARRLAGASRIEGPAGAGLATGHTTASSSSLLFRFLKTPVALRCGLAGLTGITCPRAHTHRLAMISPPLTWAWHREMQRQMDGCGCGAQRRTRDTP